MSDKNSDALLSALEAELKGFEAKVSADIARVAGLKGCLASEMLEFPRGVKGVALNLEETQVGVMILGDYLEIKQGDVVKSTGKILSVPVGKGTIGRVVNPLGEPLDGQGPIKAEATYPVERIAPRVIARQSVNTPLQTGIKAIDSMIPIGRGQRELIIGDRQTGKTALAIDTIINQTYE